MTNIYILSLGQLIKSDQQKSIKAFASILQDQLDYSALYSYMSVYFYLKMDQCLNKVVDRHNMGYLDSGQFETELSNFLGIEKTPQFKDAWNAECEITPETLGNIVNLVYSLDKTSYQLVVTSATNPMHYTYVMNRINAELNKHDLPNFDKNPNIHLAISFELYETSHSTLTSLAISRNDLDLEGNKFISFDENIRANNVVYNHATFTSLDIKHLQGCLAESEDLV